MAAKTDCYVDTSAFIAFLDRSDSYHALFSNLFSQPPRLVTSALTLAEGHGWFLRRYDARRALQFLAFLNELPALETVAFDGKAVLRTELVVKKFQDQKLTLADAHGIAIMSEKKLAKCWSTDRHLGLSGAKMVI